MSIRTRNHRRRRSTSATAGTFADAREGGRGCDRSALRGQHARHGEDKQGRGARAEAGDIRGSIR